MTTEQIEECYRKLMKYISQCPHFYAEDKQEILRILTESFMSPSARFLKACREGDLEVCKKCETSSISFSDGFVCACRYGHLNIAQWIQEMYSERVWCRVYVESLYWACVNGHLSVVRWLTGYANATVPLIKEYPQVFSEVCVQGHLKVAQLLYKIYTITTNDIQNAYLSTCKKGKTPVAVWLCDYVPRSTRKQGYFSAIYECHLELVEAIFSKDGWFSLDAYDIMNMLTSIFSKENWEGLATWLIRNYTLPADIWIYEKFIDSCKQGKLDRAKWFKNTFPRINYIEDAFYDSTITDQLEVVRWLLTFGISSRFITEVCDKHNNKTTDWLKSLITFSKDSKERFMITLLEPSPPVSETSPSPSQECNPDKPQPSPDSSPLASQFV